MSEHADKMQRSTQKTAHANPVQQKSGSSKSAFVDNRPEAIAQRKLQEAANNSPQVRQLREYQEMANNSPQVKQLRAYQEMANNSDHVKQLKAFSAMANNSPHVHQLKAFHDMANGYTTNPLQRQADPEEKLIQGKMAPVQRVADEEELLQGKFAPVQQMELDEELPVQRQGEANDLEEELLLQGRFMPVKPFQLRQAPVQSSPEPMTPFQFEQAPVQKKPNNTGLPDNIKEGVENLSGYSMDDVKVHYNSDKPTQLQALAYAQGTDIHVGPGQEQHLPHEAWHVVQQKQGRVQPTMQMKEGVAVNDDKRLESEADVMGAKTTQHNSKGTNFTHLNAHMLGNVNNHSSAELFQRVYNSDDQAEELFQTPLHLQAQQKTSTKVVQMTPSLEDLPIDVLENIISDFTIEDRKKVRLVNQNLKVLEENIPYHVSGKSVETNQKHHPHYYFDLGDGKGLEQYDFDKWITNKIAPAALGFIKEQPNIPGKVKDIVIGWDGNSSIIHSLINELIAGNPVVAWNDAQIKANMIRTGTGIGMVKQLLAQKENIIRRENDIPNNCPQELSLSTTTKVPRKTSSKKVEINWGRVLYSLFLPFFLQLHNLTGQKLLPLYKTVCRTRKGHC